MIPRKRHRTLEKMSRKETTREVTIASCDLIYLKVQFMNARISYTERQERKYKSTNHQTQTRGKWISTYTKRPVLLWNDRRTGEKNLNDAKCLLLLKRTIGDDVLSRDREVLLANEVVSSPAQLTVLNVVRPFLCTLRIVWILPQDLDRLLWCAVIRSDLNLQLLLERRNLARTFFSLLSLLQESRTSAPTGLDGLVSGLGSL